MSLLLNPRAWLALILAAVLGASHFTAYRAGRNAVQAKWDEANVEAERDAAAQAQRMREMQRAAEKRYVVQQGVRDRFIVQTVREIRHAAAPLASCPVPDGARVLLNDAALCARGDSAAACGDDQRVRNP